MQAAIRDKEWWGEKVRGEGKEMNGEEAARWRYRRGSGWQKGGQEVSGAKCNRTEQREEKKEKSRPKDREVLFIY